MKDVAAHLLMAAAGMALWTWVIFEAPGRSVYLLALVAGGASSLAAGRLLKLARWKEKT